MSVELIKTIVKTIEDNPGSRLKTTPTMIFFKELLEISENLKGGGQSSIFRRIPELF
jgi:hypothetical protein